MNKLSDLGSVLNGAPVPTSKGIYPAYGGNGILKFVNCYNYPENTIIIGRVGANCGSVNISDNKCWVSDNSLAFIVNKNNDPYYVYYLLKQLDLNKFHIGSSQPLITQTIINNIEYKYTKDKSTQAKLVEILKHIDDKIDKNNQINSKLENLVKTIYDYWFLQFEFPDENGKPYKSSGGEMVWNDELKKEIPEGWEVKKISEILSKIPSTENIKKNEYKSDGAIPIIDQSTEYICGYTNKKETIVNLKDSIIFGDHTKIIKYINFNFARGADGTQILNSNNSNLSNYLLYQQIKDFNLISQGYSRYFKFLKDKYIIIPEQKTNSDYSKLTVPINETIKNNVIENKQLMNLRDFLLPLLMNGQIGFKD